MPRIKTDEIYNFLKFVGPMAVNELTLLSKRTRSSVRESLRRLKREQSIYIKEFRQAQGTRGRQAPIYAVGNKVDALEVRTSPKIIGTAFRKRNHARLLIKEAMRRGKPKSMWAGLIQPKKLLAKD